MGFTGLIWVRPGEPPLSSVKALGEPFRTVTLFNPVVYLVSGFRWSFYSVADVPVWASVAVMAAIIAGCMAVIAWMFKSGYRLKQ